MTAKVAKNSNRGSKPGERRGGRQKNTPNRVGADLRELAQEYTAEALEALVAMVRGENGPSKVAAAREILDRGHGKASLTLDGKLGVEISGDWLYQIVDAAR